MTKRLIVSRKVGRTFTPADAAHHPANKQALAHIILFRLVRHLTVDDKERGYGTEHGNYRQYYHCR